MKRREYNKNEINEINEISKRLGAVGSGVISIKQLPLDQQENAKKIMPTVQSIVSVAVKYNQSAVQSQFQPVSNMEFKNGFKKRDSICMSIVDAFIDLDMRSVAVTETFALDYSLDTPWLISHKDIAIKAGVGIMGKNRIVLHEKHGVSIVLGSILIDKKLENYDTPTDYNPCINCNLCKVVCPTSSISTDGFDMMACYTHNYRNKGNSFNDILLRQEKGNKGLEKITFDEKDKLWASIQEGYGYSCSKCTAVCPAGKKQEINYELDRSDYFRTYVKPFIDKEEIIYALKGSRSSEYIKKNVKKTLKYVSNGMSIDSIKAFKGGLKIVFDSEKAAELNRVYQFNFAGEEKDAFAVKIDDGKLTIENGSSHTSDISVHVDSKLWIQFLQDKKFLIKGILTGKLKMKGNPKYLIEFGEIFSS